jgi:putative ABC transport system permease protein
LRALGYGAFPVAVSVILEAMLLSVTGALIGAAIAWALYDGVESNFNGFVFKETVSLALIGVAILWAVVVALLGGLLPSIRAARRPVVEALRAT